MRARVIILVLAAALVGGWFWFTRQSQPVATANVPAAPPPIVLLSSTPTQEKTRPADGKTTPRPRERRVAMGTNAPVFENAQNAAETAATSFSDGSPLNEAAPSFVLGNGTLVHILERDVVAGVARVEVKEGPYSGRGGWVSIANLR
jgi:hypothetical protein